MIERAIGTAGLSLLAAASTTSAPVPVVWHFLGYPFEAAGMIAALFACFCARWWSGNILQARKAFRWTLDIPTSAITFAATISVVIARRPEPWIAIVMGAGIGVIGEGLFIAARKAVEKFDLFGLGAPPAPDPISVLPHPLPRDIEKLTHKIDEEPTP